MGTCATFCSTLPMVCALPHCARYCVVKWDGTIVGTGSASALGHACFALRSTSALGCALVTQQRLVSPLARLLHMLCFAARILLLSLCRRCAALGSTSLHDHDCTALGTISALVRRLALRRCCAALGSMSALDCLATQARLHYAWNSEAHRCLTLSL
jgi:hypothetical protein